MSSKRMYFVLLGALVVLAGAGVASIVLGNSLLQKSAAQLNDLKLQTDVVDEQQNALAQASRDVEKYSPLEKIAKTVVPQEKDQARTVREIVKFAAESGVPITSISFPASELGNDVTTKPAAGTTPAAAAAAPLSSLTQVKPVEGIKGVYELEVAILNDKDTQVRYPALISFLKKLEQNRRTSQVTTVNIQPDPANRNLLTYSMTINVYIKP